MKGNQFILNDKILNSIVKQVVSIVAPEKIILFGSRAVGVNGVESDYDICVLKTGIRKRSLFAQKIYKGLNIMASVDVIVNTPDVYEKNKTNPFLIYSEIDKNGVVVYEK